jgi:hypothetical protein
MAGDWIKMRTDLYRDPKVILMADALTEDGGPLARYVTQNCQCDMAVTRNVTRNATVGALVSVWGVARHRGERQCDDLMVPDATLEVVDDIADLPGFGHAMERCGWLIQTPEGLLFPHFFGQHNVDPKDSGAERQRRYRKRHSNGDSNVTRNVTRNDRVEKSREEKSIKGETPLNPPIVQSVEIGPFDAFWLRVPNKIGKAAAKGAYAAAVKALRARGQDDPHGFLLDRMTAFSQTPKAGGDFCPHPATWLNQGRYDDDPATWQDAGNSGAKRNGRRDDIGPGQRYDPAAAKSTRTIGW